MKKTKTILGYIFMGAASAMLLYSAYEKLFGGETAAQMYEMLNLGQYRVLLGITEILAIVLLWIPKWRYPGTLLATGYLGGAIMAEFAMGANGVMAGGTLLALWIGTSFLNCKTNTCNCTGSCTCGEKKCDCGIEGCVCKDGVCTCAPKESIEQEKTQ